MDKKKVLYFTNLAPLYRQNLWSKMLASKSFTLDIFYGFNPTKGIKEVDIDSFDIGKSRVHKIKNYWILDKLLIWQSGVFSKIKYYKPDSIIFLGEFYCLSTWLATIYCRLKGIDTIYWGHGIINDKERGPKKWLRKIFYNLPNRHIVYERRSKKLMVASGHKPENIHVIFNSLNYEYQKKLYLSLSEKNNRIDEKQKPTILFIGRIIKEKKIELLIEAVESINRHSHQVNLLIIGDGPMRESLELRCKLDIEENKVVFLGPCYEEDKLSEYISQAHLCVSPGNIGLAAIHALSFGTPIATHSNYNTQGPEAETIIDGQNGFLFEENNHLDLAKKIRTWIFESENNNPERCREIIDQYYNPQYQMGVLEDAIFKRCPKLNSRNET